MVSKHLHWYARDLEAYDRDTRHLSMLEHGAYTLLLDHYYRTKGNVYRAHVEPIFKPANDNERVALERVIDEYFTIDKNEQLRHKRADAEMKKAFAINDKRVAAAHSRWNANAHAGAMTPTPTHTPTEVQGQKKGQKKEHTPRSARLTPLPADLEVWKAEIGPKLKAWAKAKGHDRLPEHFESFVLSFRSSGKKQADWYATLQNWINKGWTHLPPIPPKQSL